MTILVTGGAGYIGTHSLVELHNHGIPFIVVDNFSNSSPAALRAVESIIGSRVPVIRGDVRDRSLLEHTFRECRESGSQITGVLHLAALKAVGESVREPLRYYDNNVQGTLVLLDVMQQHGARNFVFSSSATVYGDPQYLPYDEEHPVAPTNPYGQTKAAVEKILADLSESDPTFSTVILRYFNPIGAHVSGLIGEDPRGMPNNLFPFVTRVAVGRLPELQVFGSDYPTADGTGVRDYLHVMDLARAHAVALNYAAEKRGGRSVFNLGTGRGTSVLDLVRAFELASGRKIPLRFVDRRPGDVAQMWADATPAKALLGWEARFDIERMCIDGWRWQSANPDGFVA